MRRRPDAGAATMDENSRTAWILVAMFVIMFIVFVAAVYGLVIHDWRA